MPFISRRGWSWSPTGQGVPNLLASRKIATAMLGLLLLAGLACAWDPNAGLVEPLAKATRTISVTSNEAAKSSIIDGNDQTQWQSGACFPTGWIGRADMNALLNICTDTPAACATSLGSRDLARGFDNNFYTGAAITKGPDGQASIRITLPGPTDIYRIFFRGGWNKGVAKLSLVTQGLEIPVSENLTSSWVDQKLMGPWPLVTQLLLVSNDTFTLTEIAAQHGRCWESATMDMQEVYSVNLIRARWWSTAAESTNLSYSADGIAWTKVADVKPDALPSADFYFEQAIQVRYVKIHHMVKEADWMKIYAWEIGAYGAGGRWGLPPPALPQTRSFRQLLGLNGIWGWGSGSYSSTAAKAGQGPWLYNAVASSGRNYQSMVWDVKKPGNDPRWDTMNKTGTDGQWWLDWDREYRAWKAAGIPVSVTYQFLAKEQPPSSWSDPYGISYQLGFKFARHFGKTAGTGTVESFEVGNEPWDYNATFYSTLLRGFINGLADGDPTIKRLPCALQANEPMGESSTGGNYIGARVSEEVAPKLDALNLHIYSYFNLQNGTRVAVHPEHPGSSMNGLHNFLAWRNTNMPGKPVWVTEWGWDAARPGEDCGATTECVSQLAQAAYGIRGLALLARKGVEQVHWFFYANDDKCNTLFCRSGLRDTKTAGFGDLPVYRSFNVFLQLAGASVFQSAVKESPQLYVYVFGSAAGTRTHVLAWRPIPVGDTDNPADKAVVQFDIGFVATAASAVDLTGVVPGGSTAVQLPVISDTTWSMELSGIPTLVVLQQP